MTHNDRDKIIIFPGAAGTGMALRVRVDLLLMPAPVWRLLLLPGDCTFWDLHVAIQDAFGWQDRHLHQFTLDEPRAGTRLRVGIPDESGLPGAEETQAGWKLRVTAYLRPSASPALYTYDFGDEWLHEVALEGIVQEEEAARLPRCLDGAGHPPSEDCGGPDAVAVDQVAVGEPFAPLRVVFTNPRQRWHRTFGDG